MKLNILVLCVIFSTARANECLAAKDSHEAISADEIADLKRTFSQLLDLKFGTGECSTGIIVSKQRTNHLLNDSSIFDVRFDDLPEECRTMALPRSCAEATACTKRSGIYKIKLAVNGSEPILVECDVKTDGGGWTLIQRRQDGSVDFYRNWDEYRKGFGNIAGEFFIGLDNLHALTNFNGPQELLVVVEHKGDVRYAKYSNFVIGNEKESYALKHLGSYSGDAGDSLLYHLGMKFSTKDRDHDIVAENCADLYPGAWWYTNCYESHLNGKYGKKIEWKSLPEKNISVQYAKMMIRRRRF